MKPYEKIRIVFDGPPSHESGRFIEVENERAQSVSFGEWVEEGEFWYLEFPNPAKLEEVARELATLVQCKWEEFGSDDGVVTIKYPWAIQEKMRELCAALLTEEETP